MKTIKILFSLIIGFLLFFVVMVIQLTRQVKNDFIEIRKNYENKVDSLQRINDSLNVVLFPLEVEHTRYEIALEKLHEINPSAVDQFYQIVQQETE